MQFPVGYPAAMLHPRLRRAIYLLAVSLAVSISLLELAAMILAGRSPPAALAFTMMLARFVTANALVWVLWTAAWAVAVRLLWCERMSWDWRRAVGRLLLILLPLTALHGAALLLLFGLLPFTAGGFFPRAYDAYAPQSLTRFFFAEVGQGVLVMGFGLAYVYYTAVREGEVALERARLQTLRLQLQPHTLFNTLNGAVTLIRRRDNDAATALLLRLADHLRSSLETDPSLTCSLSAERDSIANYLDLQRVRYGDRLREDIAFPAELLDSSVPTAILQSLVENALCHGLDQKSDAGRISIQASATPGGRLELSVEDDGPGFAPDYEERIGLGNTRERLRRMYGDGATLSLESGASGGARVVVRIPRLQHARSGSLAGASTD